MYERLSDRSRLVMQVAQQEAQRLNNGYVGTEHILLAVVKEGCGCAAKFLSERYGLGIATVRRLTEKWSQPGPDTPVTGKLPLTPRANSVVTLAIRRAEEFQSGYVGTEHLLLGIMDETEGIARAVLIEAGVTHDAVLGWLTGLPESEKRQPMPTVVTFPASVGTWTYHTGNLDALAGLKPLRKPRRNSQQLIDSTKTMKYRGVPVQELDRESLLAMIGYMALKITNAGAIRQDRADRLTSMREQIDRLVSDGMTIEDALAKVSPEPRREPPRPADERDEMRDFFFKTKE